MALTLPSARRAAAIDFGPVEELGFSIATAKPMADLRRQIAGLDLSTSGGLMDLSGLYAQRGQVQDALKTQALSRDLAAQRCKEGKRRACGLVWLRVPQHCRAVKGC